MFFFRKKICILFACIFSLSFSVNAEKFRFKFRDGDSYRINSIVTESVYVNNKFSHKADITNRVTVDVSDVKTGAFDSALFTCSYMTSEKNTNRAFEWSKSYPSMFRRNALGMYDISDEYFMPVVRNVPVFSSEEIRPGESWSGKGHEAHDLRTGFNITRPFVIPFDIEYTYVGKVEYKGKKLDLIKAKYQMMHTLPDEVIKKNTNVSDVFPVTTFGFSEQKLYWDNEQGRLPYYTEEFSIRLVLNTGECFDFSGEAEAEIVEFKRLDKKQTTDKLKEDIKKLGLDNTDVKESDEGVTISIENIQFKPDSAILLDSEKQKIQKIGELLKKYSERDLLVSGHTALAGTKEGRQILSEKRAGAVADYLIELGIKDAHRVFTRGFGADKPIAKNDTEENKSRNRRVEITILEK